MHAFLEAYERTYPDEVVHIEQPINADWELSALATKLEKEKRFPILIAHRVIADGQELELPLVTFMMASRLRLARAFGVDVREAGLACYRRLQNRLTPTVVARQDAPVKQVIETGDALDVR